MTPLFAPKPAPRGIGFGPGYGEQPPAQPSRPAPYPPSMPAWTGTPPTPQIYGWGGWPSPYGPMPGAIPFGQGAAGFDPLAQQQMRGGGFGQPWTGLFR
jgi:hypothetical protein